MLKQRILTAVVLMALLLPALIVENVWPFAVLTLIAMALAGWEWSRLNDAGALATALGAALGAACLLALYAGWTTTAPRLAWWIALAIWVLGGTWVLRAGVAGWPRVPRPLRWAIGLVALWTAWLALANAKAIGLNFILSAFVLVWAADVFAYFGGRAFGKRKLAPSISPGKTVVGLYGGIAAATLLGGAWVLAMGLGLPLLALAPLCAAAAQAGDLFESGMKRRAGVKDSGAWLPGHGGVLDRLDGLVPVAVLTVLAQLLGLT